MGRLDLERLKKATKNKFVTKPSKENYTMKDYIEQLQIEYQAILDKPLCTVTDTDFINYYDAVARVGSEIVDKAHKLKQFENSLCTMLKNLDDVSKKKTLLEGFRSVSDDPDELMVIDKLMKGIEM